MIVGSGGGAPSYLAEAMTRWRMRDGLVHVVLARMLSAEPPLFFAQVAARGWVTRAARDVRATSCSRGSARVAQPRTKYPGTSSRVHGYTAQSNPPPTLMPSIDATFHSLPSRAIAIFKSKERAFVGNKSFAVTSVALPWIASTFIDTLAFSLPSS